MKISDTVKVLRLFIVVFSNHLPSKDNDYSNSCNTENNDYVLGRCLLQLSFVNKS